MLNRSNLFLAALLLAQIVLIAISALLTGGAEERAVQPILAKMAATDVERVTITDDLDNEMIFARSAGGWVLPEADNFPLDSEKVDEILDKLASLNTRRLVASNPANYARLEVKEDEFRRRVELEGAGSATVLYLGGSGGVDTVYARRADDEAVYLGSGLNSWELSTQVSTWLDATYVNVPLDDVLEISVQNTGGSFTFARDGEDWSYAGLSEGDVFEDTKIPIILRNAASIRILEPLSLTPKDEFELDPPAAVVEVRYRQRVEDETLATDESDETEAADDEAVEVEIEYKEASYSLIFGAALQDSGIVMKSSDAEYYVLVRDTIFNAFNDLKHDDLVKAPEAEPESE